MINQTLIKAAKTILNKNNLQKIWWNKKYYLYLFR